MAACTEKKESKRICETNGANIFWYLSFFIRLVFFYDADETDFFSHLTFSMKHFLLLFLTLPT